MMRYSLKKILSGLADIVGSKCPHCGAQFSVMYSIGGDKFKLYMSHTCLFHVYDIEHTFELNAGLIDYDVKDAQ